MSVPASIDGFLDQLTVERQSSKHTIDAYRRDLQALAAWAALQGHDDVAALQDAQLRAFVADEHRRGLAPKSLQRRLSACRSFYRWLLRHGRVAANPAAALRAPKAPRKLPQVLDVDEAVQLVEVPTDAPLGLRDRALLPMPGVGLVAVGSRDPNRFYPGMGALFLRMMAESLAVALQRFDRG